jgi:glycosyltransferase involved in cell wall biosynthesis
MKIAILGSRGIPNNFGGFEQCAEKIGLHLVQRGHSVTVYNSRDHVYRDSEWQGIRIRHIFSDDKKLKFASPFIYDYLSLKDAVKRDFDIILELGAQPAALFYSLKQRTKARIVTNMAGLEWKRSKWNALARRIIRHAEALAVQQSDALIADNRGIQEYLQSEYGRSSHFVAYGAELYDSPNLEHLKAYGVERGCYEMLVARFQPDNNFEMILDGYVRSESNDPFIVVGHCTNTYGKFLRSKYKAHPSIRFVGGIYDYDVLSSLRWFSRLYFHGHSCGGTNPSLLEAMASSALVAAHDNRFNRYVLGRNGFYFHSSREVSALIDRDLEKHRVEFTRNNRAIIDRQYRWEDVSDQYLNVFEQVLSGSGR